MKTQQEVNRAVERYSDMVRRLCLVHLKNRFDTEDIFQTVFLKYIVSDVEFCSGEHEKAWIIRVTINSCRDFLKSFFRRHTISLENLLNQPEELSSQSIGVLEAVLSLPEKYRDVIYLHYVEGYSASEIGQILKKNTNTVYTHLGRGKKLLKQKLGGDLDE